MKKILLSAAAFAVVAVSAVSIAPTTSEAIPAFARQTGAACLSCHFQTFPAVTAFGRAFKMSGFTDVGEQALIEDDGLSIPSSLNATFVLRAQYQNISNNLGVTNANWNIPADAVLMIAGRFAETFGAFLEVDLQGGGAVNYQIMNSNDMGSFRAGLNIYNAGFGPTGAIEISNVFGQHGGKLNGKAVSATEALFQMPTNGGGLDTTTAVALWAGNEMGLIQIAAIAPSAATTGTIDPRFATLVRAVYTPEIAGMNGLIGFGVMTGSTGTAAAGTAKVSAFFVDGQLQGDIGDTSVGIYVDYASNKGQDTLALIQTPLATSALTAYSARIEVKPLHNVMFGIGYGAQQSNVIATPDTTITNVAATYELYQNVEINAYWMRTATGPTTSTEKFLEIEALM